MRHESVQKVVSTSEKSPSSGGNKGCYSFTTGWALFSCRKVLLITGIHIPVPVSIVRDAMVGLVRLDFGLAGVCGVFS